MSRQILFGLIFAAVMSGCGSDDNDPLPADTQAPVLSAIQISGTTSTSATIDFASDEAANAQIDYADSAYYATHTDYDQNKQTTGYHSVHSHILSNLSPATTYHYRIVVKDAAGNTTTGSDRSFTTQTPDTSAPTISDPMPAPLSVLSAGTTSTTLGVTTDEGAQCRYATTSGTAYSAMANSFTTTGATTHSTVVAGLTDGGAYSYYIRCQDANDNMNTTDFTVAFSIAADVNPPVALQPILHFSDIDSGPKTGNTDGLGSGAIVTVWGNHLGDDQGTSKIYIDDVEAAHVYYWGKADGGNAAGPADLSTYHNMQTVSFSIPATVSDGLVYIHTEVNGKISNSYPFTVRAGNIYFVSPSGSDGNSGSWQSPWETLSHAGSGAGGTLEAGDIVYATDGSTENDGLRIVRLLGTAEKPFSLIAYPGAHVLIQNSGSYGIGHHSAASAYWNFSKLTIKTGGTGIDTFKGLRAIANEVTNYPGGCANGQGGAIAGNNLSGIDTVSGVKALGNYIHDFGCDTTSKLHHVFYISNRGGFSAEAFELGWNHLRDNKAHHALHVFDEGICGDYTGTVKIHDNAVVNQVGVAVGVASGAYNSPCFTMPVDIYNNLFINVGLEIPSCDGHHTTAMSFVRQETMSHIRVYNNTLIGYGEPGDGGALVVTGGSGLWTFGGTWEFINNIIVDTNDLPFTPESSVKLPSISKNNLWYNGGDSTPSGHPSWDTSVQSGDPGVDEFAVGSYTLKATSPATANGADTSSLVNYDLTGYPRPPGAFSIGAFEYHDNAAHE